MTATRLQFTLFLYVDRDGKWDCSHSRPREVPDEIPLKAAAHIEEWIDEQYPQQTSEDSK